VKNRSRSVPFCRRSAGRLAELVLLALLLASCSLAPGSTAPVVRFGLVAPFEGRHRRIGYDVIYAARLAVREANARGGIEGYRVELVALDDSGDPDLAVQAARSLTIDTMVLAAMGHWLEETTAASRPIYHASGLAFIEMGQSTGRMGEIPEEFAENYQAVAPFGEGPGPLAQGAYTTCVTLMEAIEQAIAADGRPTRAAVAAALSHH